MRLYTPGHHEFTDTLIMYGLVKVIKVARPLVDVKVNPMGERFLLEADITHSEFVDSLKDEGRNLLSHIVRISLSSNIPYSLRVNMLQRGNEGGRNLKMNKGKLEYNKEGRDYQLENVYHSCEFLENIREYWKDVSLDADHKFSEGKSKCGGRLKTRNLVTANLPIAPYAGTVQKVGSFYLCKLCSALAWIGLWNFSTKLVLVDSKTQTTYINLIKPETTVYSNLLFMVENIGEISNSQHQIIRKHIPISSIPFILLSFGETSAALFRSQWKSLIYTISSERKDANWRTAVRSYSTYPINNLLLFFEKAKIYSPNVARLTHALIPRSGRENLDGVHAISMLNEAIIYKDVDMLHRAFRLMNKTLKSDILDNGIIKAAFEVCA